jgi:hypothetical protein
MQNILQIWRACIRAEAAVVVPTPVLLLSPQNDRSRPSALSVPFETPLCSLLNTPSIDPRLGLTFRYSFCLLEGTSHSARPLRRGTATTIVPSRVLVIDMHRLILAVEFKGITVDMNSMNERSEGSSTESAEVRRIEDMTADGEMPARDTSHAIRSASPVNQLGASVHQRLSIISSHIRETGYYSGIRTTGKRSASHPTTAKPPEKMDDGGRGGSNL